MRGALRIGMLVAIAATATACDKKNPDPAPQPAASASVAAANAAEGAEAGAAEAGAAKAPEAGFAFSGKYAIKPATLYIPDSKDWGNVKFKNDEARHVGEGELSLEIDASGRVSGTTEGGALGAAVIEGSATPSATPTALTATIRRKDPTDQGLTGTIVGTIAAGKIEGTMKLSDANASAVREATFSASKK